MVNKTSDVLTVKAFGMVAYNFIRCWFGKCIFGGHLLENGLFYDKRHFSCLPGAGGSHNANLPAATD